MKNIFNFRKVKGFTLIELLVVIAIIAMLSTIIIGPIQSARQKARQAKRSSELNSLKTAMTLYLDDNGNYPVTTNGVDTGWRSQCSGWGGIANSSVAPGSPALVPNYLPKFPTDPLNPNASTAASNCYIYRSNGAEYKILLYDVTEGTPSSNFTDSARTTVSGHAYWAICDGVTACSW